MELQRLDRAFLYNRGVWCLHESMQALGQVLFRKKMLSQPENAQNGIPFSVLWKPRDMLSCYETTGYAALTKCFAYIILHKGFLLPAHKGKIGK
jgi:hypothetical protein